jgi:hypothetical protein
MNPVHTLLCVSHRTFCTCLIEILKLVTATSRLHKLLFMTSSTLRENTRSHNALRYSFVSADFVTLHSCGFPLLPFRFWVWKQYITRKVIGRGKIQGSRGEVWISMEMPEGMRNIASTRECQMPLSSVVEISSPSHSLYVRNYNTGNAELIRIWGKWTDKTVIC